MLDKLLALGAGSSPVQFVGHTYHPDSGGLLSTCGTEAM